MVGNFKKSLNTNVITVENNFSYNRMVADDADVCPLSFKLTQ